MDSRLIVWLNGEVSGTLETDARGDVHYVPTQGDVLSAASSGMSPWSAELTRNWFDGLLPEGDRRLRLAGRVGVLPGDTFGLLREVGWECAGAVSVLPEGVDPRAGTHDIVSDQIVRERLDALPSLAEIPDSEIRVSLGGLQEKLLLARLGNQWAIPKDGAPSTHILKPEPERWPGFAVAEAWALTAASSVTEAAAVTVADDLGSRPVLIVTRYDRVIERGVITRLHQEDLCQALGLPPSAKYATIRDPGVPSIAGMAHVLTLRAADPPLELERLLRQVVASVALRNADLHGKNLAILYDAGGSAKLAPAYDVLTTTAFESRQTSIGLTVGGKFKLSEIGTDHLIREAVSWGIPERRAKEIVAAALLDLQIGIEHADEAWPAVPSRVREQAVAGVFLTGLARPGYGHR